MRCAFPTWVVALALAFGPTAATAQDQGQPVPPQAPIVATPLMPPSVQYPPQTGSNPAPEQQPQQQPAPTGTSQAPATALPQIAPAPGQPAPPATDTPAAPQPAPPLPNIWLPQGSAVLQLLDKVNAQSSTVTVKVGQSITYGTLAIAVQACEIRPSDQPQDATAYLSITDSHADQPGFKGWMLKSDPELSMLQHPIYDVRVIGCAP
jgi:hypothetical protein